MKRSIIKGGLFIRGIILPVLLAAFSLCTPPGISSAQDKAPDPLAVLQGMEAAYAKVDNYTATFIKRELVNGELLPEETVSLKFKKPFKVYMKWVKEPHKNREAMYVRGMYDNKVVGHEGGLISFVTLHMAPTGSTAMKGNRHPITDVGIGRLMEIVSTNVRRAVSAGELTLSSKGEEELYGRKVRRYDAELPREKDKGYYARRIRLWVDAGLGLPIRIEVYGWNEELLESYGYRDLKINPGLTDAEFDEKYKGYDF